MDKFLSTYTEFYTDLQKIEPSLKQQEAPFNESHLYSFVENAYPHMTALCQCQLKEEHTFEVFPGIVFYTLVSSLSKENQDVAWDYVHHLLAISFSLPEVKAHASAKDGVAQFPNMISHLVDRRRERYTPTEMKKPTEETAPKIDETFFENSVLASLAKEISSEINPQEFLDMKEPPNPADILSAIMGGDNNSDKNKNGLGKLMNAVVGKLQKKIQSGEVNQAKLFDEAKQVLNGLSAGGLPGMPDFGNFANMMQNMASMGELFGAKKKSKSRNHKTSTRERLRKKQQEKSKVEEKKQ